MINKGLAVLFSCIICSGAQANLWQDTSEAELQQRGIPTPVAQQNQVFRFNDARLLHLDMASLNSHLNAALPEGSAAVTTTIQLPLPHGEFADYQLYRSPVMAPGLAAKYPEIRTFKIIGLDNAAHTGRLDLTPQGFHAVLQHNAQTVFIDPIGHNNQYQSYYKRDYVLRKVSVGQHKPFVCGTGDHTVGDPKPLLAERLFDPTQPPRAARLSFGGQIKTYRLAVALTGEFTRFHGGTKAQGLAALVTGINRINEVYERDLAVKLELIADNDKIIYTNPATDAFNPNSFFNALADQSITVINREIGPANYDVGHVIHGEGIGGQAGLGVICRDNVKAGGETASDSPVNDPFFIDFVAHELGHQFGSQHSFNGTSQSCGGGNRSSGHAYEPGSGSTIMGYAGICPNEDLQRNSDAYFHSDSIEQIRAHLDNGSGHTCGVASGSNQLPTVAAGSDKVIPKQTPFTLTGSGSDSDGDTLTYTWEQLDLGPSTNSRAGLVDNGSGPIFRSFTPTTSPSRTLPKLSDVLAGTTTYGEVMPATGRELNFSLTVRDGKGGVASDEMKVQVVDTAGPFKITAPTTTSWTAGNQTIGWDIANTNAAPISCATVKIDLSTNGGTSFPTTLLASTANDGSATVNVPAIATSQGRIRISCTSQPFFAVNSANLTISGDGTGNGTNNAPVALNDSFSFAQSTNTRQLDVLSNDTDSDNDTLTITQLDSSGDHIINIADGGKSVTFKHSSGFSGTVNFSYIISDGTAEASANVTVTVSTPTPTPPNQVPNANGDHYEVQQDSTANTLTPLDNDTDADGHDLIITAINSISDGGTATIASDGKSINYQPASGFNGDEVINYTIRDTRGDTASANFIVTVTAAENGNDDQSDSDNDGGGGSAGLLLLFSLLLLVARRRRRLFNVLNA